MEFYLAAIILVPVALGLLSHLFDHLSIEKVEVRKRDWSLDRDAA